MLTVRNNAISSLASRHLKRNTNELSKTLTKLASGFRINSAADDAAGLAVSESMKAQIKSLEAASLNSQDGISLIRTADGALGEIHDVLNGTMELAVKAANGVYTDDQRKNYIDEVVDDNALIDMIAKNASFNGIHLFDGTLSASKESAINGTGIVSLGLCHSHSGYTDMGIITDIEGARLADTGVLRTVFEYQDYNGEQKAISIELFVQNAKENNQDVSYLVSTTGAKYKLNSYIDGNANKLLANDIAKSLYLELNSNYEWYSRFTTVGRDNNNAIVTLDKALSLSFFPIAKDGEVASITGISVTMKRDDKIETEWDYSQILWEDERHTEPSGEYQIIDFMNVPVLTAKDAMAIDKDGNDVFGQDDIISAHQKVFTVNGKRFVFANASEQEDMAMNAALLKEAGLFDVHIIGVSRTSVSHRDDGEHIVAEINRVAGTNLKFTSYAEGASVGYPTIFFPGDEVSYEGDMIYRNPYTIYNGNKLEMLGANTTSKGEELVLQIGDSASEFNKLRLSFEDMSAKALGTDKIDVSTVESAGKAIPIIKAAIDKVSSMRSYLGAMQNRLEHTVNNIDVMAENITAANSRIRDTDMAKQMTEYTKLNVIIQSAQSMLAQANQLPQSVLNLLR